jgi:spore coat-associated protein N
MRTSRRSVLGVRLALAGLAGVLVAFAMAYGSGGLLGGSGSEQRASAVVLRATGFSFTNSKNGAAILSISNMKPGTSQSDTVTIGNDGTIDGTVALHQAITGDTHPNGLTLLSDQLNVKIEDVTGSPATPPVIYDGTIGAMTDKSLGSFPAGTSHTYKFTFSLPDTGATSGPGLQDATTTVRYDWTATG